MSLLLVIPAAVSVVYFMVADRLLERWVRDRPNVANTGVDLPPVTYFRPLKSGVPDLFDKLSSLAGAMKTGDQLLIGVEACSPEMATAEKVRCAYPDCAISVVSCELAGAQNPKLAKLLQMEAHARHEHWILSDSEVVTDVDLAAAFRREWLHCDVLTAGYRFSRIANWPQRLDAAAVLLTLWPGLAVLRASGRIRLTLGAWTGFRRDDLQAIGGWGAFADELAEDNRLGQALAAAGRTIRLSASVVTLQCDALTWRDYWQHQRRVAVTYRVANTPGFAGAILAQGVTMSLLLACWRPAELWTWLLFATVLAVRWVTARRAARVLGFSIPLLLPTVFLASLVETGCWALSWGTRFVWWGGIRRRISRRGRLLPVEPR